MRAPATFVLCAWITLASMELAAQHSLQFLALGDSYTIGESVAEAERWPHQLAEALRAQGLSVATPRIIATTGWRTDDLQRAVQAAKLSATFDLVSLLIGVNNQYQGKPIAQYEREFRELLEMAIARAGHRTGRVVVLSIPDYGYTPFGESRQAVISRELDVYNAMNKRISESRGVAYVDITPISRQGLAEPSLVASDRLHPSGEMYKRWVARMLPEVLRLLR